MEKENTCDYRKRLYALITRRCNLTCPHCDVYKLKDDFNEEKFLSYLHKYDGRIILFGGECSLYPNRIKLLLNDDEINYKIESATTNLVILNDELIECYKQIKHLGTSWNPGRFTDYQYNKWMENIHELSKYEKITTGVLITLTDSLFEYDFDKFLHILNRLDREGNINNIKFENFVGPGTDRSYFRRSDEFLCKLYDHWNWNFKMRFETIDRVLSHYMDCSFVEHLNPDGSVETGCAHIAPIQASMDCLLCENNSICKPCQLQQYCTMPYNFIKKVYEDIDSGKLSVPEYLTKYQRLNLDEVKKYAYS